MPKDSVMLHTDTVLAQGLFSLLQTLETRLELQRKINVFLAGGMAVHLYTGTRVTTDVDAEFGARIFLPNDLVLELVLEDGTQHLIYFDTNYNASFALLHEDYLDDALPVPFSLPHFEVYVLSPVDLAVSKIARFAANDQDDIQALVRAGLTSAAAIETRAEAALAGYVGGLAMLRLNLQDAVKLAEAVEGSLN